MDNHLQPLGAPLHLESASFNDCVSSVLSGFGDGISSSSENLSISLRSEGEEEDDDDDDENDHNDGRERKERFGGIKERQYEEKESLFSSFSKPFPKQLAKKVNVSGKRKHWNGKFMKSPLLHALDI